MMQRTTQDVLDPIGKQIINLDATTPQGLTLPTLDGNTSIARRAFISIETAGIRYYLDGSVPSSSDGHPKASGTDLVVDGINALRKFKAVGQSSTPKLTVTYFA